MKAFFAFACIAVVALVIASAGSTSPVPYGGYTVCTDQDECTVGLDLDSALSTAHDYFDTNTFGTVTISHPAP